MPKISRKVSPEQWDSNPGGVSTTISSSYSFSVSKLVRILPLFVDPRIVFKLSRSCDACEETTILLFCLSSSCCREGDLLFPKSYTVLFLLYFFNKKLRQLTSKWSKNICLYMDGRWYPKIDIQKIEDFPLYSNKLPLYPIHTHKTEAGRKSWCEVPMSKKKGKFSNKNFWCEVQILDKKRTFLFVFKKLIFFKNYPFFTFNIFCFNSASLIS